jgi:hypothetical protein
MRNGILWAALLTFCLSCAGAQTTLYLSSRSGNDRHTGTKSAPLRPGSPARRLGFQEIDTGQIGLRKSFPFLKDIPR